MSGSNLPSEVKTTISRLRKRLVDKYPDVEAYLFGSYANGTWLDDSDFDIVVVSGKFSGQSFVDRVAKIRRLAPTNKPFEILAYTPAEFRVALRRSLVLRDGRRYWRKIA